MKNIMKKIIFGSFVFAFLFLGFANTNTYASGPFNGTSGDCDPDVAIGVYGDIDRDSYGCWTRTSVSAEPGDIINVAMYFRNNTNKTLTDVAGSITKSSSGYNDSFTFTGRMYSDQGDQTLGTVTVNLPSDQKLIYKSTHIMEGASAVRNDRDTDVVYNDGGRIELDDLSSGWNDFGEILVVYEVSDDNDDDDDNKDSSCEIDSFTASDTSIDEGDDLTLKWRTTGCDEVTLTSFGDVDDDDSVEVSPNEDKTYYLKVYDDDGDLVDTDSIKIYVDEDSDSYTRTIVKYIDDVSYVNSDNIVTTLATNITTNSASLNGFLPNSKDQNVYFEYGTSVNLGYRTSSKYLNDNTSFSETISGLETNTIYFFRAVGENSKGSIQIFRTLGGAVARPTIIQGTTVSGYSSPIMLKIENKYVSIAEGDDIDYTVTYRNISRSILRDSILQVVAPVGVEIVNYSTGTYDKDTNTLTVDLENLDPNESGVLYLEGIVRDIDSYNAQIVSTAIIVYTNTNGAQENAIAYVLNNPKDKTNNNFLGATAFFGDLFPSTLIGWLIVIILILILVLIARSIYHKKEREVAKETETKTKTSFTTTN